nr:hypothetical protein [Tanacetum cinerariifolium]
MLDEDDDVYTEATPLARKVPVVDCKIIELNNKPYYKIIRVDGTHQLYISFLTLLKNFDREDFEALWSLVKESFSTSKPKNFSDDFLLTTLGAMFEKPNAQDQVWKNQRNIHAQAKCCQAKLMLLDNTAEARLMLLSHINVAKLASIVEFALFSQWFHELFMVLNEICRFGKAIDNDPDGVMSI